METARNHLTIGVAGHIDHGKTALVKALTGIDTDRLKEEKERGMSIVLGFAHMSTARGEIDFIDVPGHEKFVRAMISGATGIDAGLLVVAADERVKPQTVEHISVMDLLGITRGAIAVTKADLVPALSAEGRSQIESEVRHAVSGTFLEGSRIVFTSALTGEGLAELDDAFCHLIATTPPTATGPTFYLPIDRSFSATGHGTVVTGTLRRGRIETGDKVDLVFSESSPPSSAIVRSLETHSHGVVSAEPGRRVAVNLRGVKAASIGRGAALVTPGALQPTRLLDARLRVLGGSSTPVTRGGRWALFFGTSEVEARVFPLDRDKVDPGGDALVQFRLEREAVVPIREPFVIRRRSPAETIGGGKIVDANPRKHSAGENSAAATAQIMEAADPKEMIVAKLAEAGVAGRNARELYTALGLWQAEGDAVAVDPRVVACLGGWLAHADAIGLIRESIKQTIDRFHAENPTLPGITGQELRTRFSPEASPALFQRALSDLTQCGHLATKEDSIMRAGFSPEAALSPVQQKIKSSIEDSFRRGGLTPPDAEKVIGGDRRSRRLYDLLVRSGALVQLFGEDRRGSNRAVTFHRDAVRQAACALHNATGADGLSVSEINALLGTTRKYAIPLLEYLDRCGFTVRTGDRRVCTQSLPKELEID